MASYNLSGATVTVSSKLVALPTTLPTPRGVGQVNSINNISVSPNGKAVWVMGKAVNEVIHYEFLLRYDGRDFVEATGYISKNVSNFERFLSPDAQPRLVDGPFMAQDAQLLAGPLIWFSDGKGGTKLNRVIESYSATSPNPAPSVTCTDAAGFYQDGVLDSAALLGSGPDPSADGANYVSAVRSPSANRKVGIYKLGAPTSGTCILTQQFQTDARYDLPHVSKESTGTFLVERWLQGATSLDTEIVRYSGNGGQMSVLASTNSSVFPTITAVHVSGLVTDPTGTTSAFPYEGTDGKFHIMATRNGGEVREVLALSKTFFEMAIVAVSGDWVEYVVGNGSSTYSTGLPQWTSLRAVNIVNGAQAALATVGGNVAGITVSSIDPHRAGIDANGNAWYAVPGITDRIVNTTITVVPDPIPAPKVVSFAADATTVTAGDPVNLSWKTSGTTFVTIQGLGVDELARFPASGGIVVRPDQTGPYILNASGPGGIASASLTVKVIPAGIPPSFVATAVVNAASFKTPPTAGMVTTVFGSNFADSTVEAITVPLPTSLAGTQVLVNGKATPLWFVSPGQANFQMPWDATGATATVQIVSSQSASAVVTISLANVAPGLFMGADGNVIAQDSQWALITATNPAKVGDAVVIYGTGFGPANCQVETGEPTPAGLCWTLSIPRVTVGGQEAVVLYSGLGSGMVGVDQLNIIIPPQASSAATALVVVTVNGQKSSDTAKIAIAAQ